MTTLFFMILSIGCGDKTSDTSPAEDTSPEVDTSEETDSGVIDYAFSEADLVGTWQTPCFPSPQGDGSYNQLTFEMTETGWDLDYIANMDDACTAPFMTVNIAGDYSLEDVSDVADGARNATFGFTTKTVTAHNETAAGFVMQACGFETAAENTPIDISEGCPGLGAYPIADCPADYDIVMIGEEGTLHFGARPADNNMCTPDKRPTSFEGGAVVTKQ